MFTSAFLPLLLTLFSSTTDVLGLHCSNKFEIDYLTVANFTDHMCAYCLDTMRRGHGRTYPEWRDSTSNDVWDMNLTVSWAEQHYHGNQIINYKSKEVIYTVSYEKLLKAIRENRTEEDLVLRQFSSDFYIDIFMNCCYEAKKCCEKSILQESGHLSNDHCPVHWDGWTCWDSTPSGSAAEAVCPDMSLYQLTYLPKKCLRSWVTKQCDRGGHWHQVWNPHYQTMTGQTNYTVDCFFAALGVRWATSTTTIILHSLSLGTTAVGLLLFIFYKLYATAFRLQIHVHFFVSVVLTSVITLHYELLVRRPHLSVAADPLVNHPFACKVIDFLNRDFRLMNFFWMIIEGVNFHHMVVFTFTDLSRFRVAIYAFGWGLPHLIMGAYALVRANVGPADDVCWTSDIGLWELLYIIPCYLCFLVNLGLFINLLRVIVVKLMLRTKSNHSHYTSHFVKRGVKTSLVLLPIFGLQYAIEGVPVDPTETCSSFALFILYLQTIVEGLQGIIVTTALCFLNKEVYSCVRKSISSMDSGSNSMLTASNNLSETSTTTTASTPEKCTSSSKQ